jgi:Na+/proline symporter
LYANCHHCAGGPGGLLSARWNSSNAAFAQNPQQGYVMVLRDYLPPALRGIMIAAFLAAFMSTLATRLNWGTSYLVNDFYRRFLMKDGSDGII